MDERRSIATSALWRIVNYAGIFLATLILADTSYSGAPAATEPRARTLNGTLGVFFEGNRGHRSPSVRQDWDQITDIDMSYAAPTDRLWRLDLSARLTTDLDGRRPSNEPGIYNGIRETFEGNVQPWLYRAVASKTFDSSLGPLTVPSVSLGRQYRQSGDFLWFDGAAVGASVARSPYQIAISGFGGVPVRLYTSATDDWMAGLEASLAVRRTHASAEIYHITDHRQSGGVVRDNVARLAIRSAIGDKLNVSATGRATEAEGIEVRSNALWRPGISDITIRGDYRYQGEDRGQLSTELDAASAIHGRALGAPRRAFQEFGLAASLPYRDWFVLDVGGSTRETKSAQDRYNLDFDRLYAALSVPSLPILRKVSAGATFELYESGGDYTRSVSGELSTKIRDRLRASLGSSYSLYSYDYATNELKDDVRSITGKLDWRYRDGLRFEARYDGEYDDRTLHHYLKLGARYEL